MDISPVIRQLPQDLIMKIAAGEVVERPASIVKELVENSIDAGATRIEIKVLEGGKKSIEVVDDGCGIRKSELNLALENHSTSKIQNLNDLSAITTMGFRGEALSSISSVAKMSISSRHQDATEGWSVTSNGGEKEELKPVALGSGTRILVEDIFYKLPARQKFLRTTATEMYNIEQAFIRLALANQDISFSLSRDNKLIHNIKTEQATIKGTANKSRITELLGKELGDNMLALDEEVAGYRISGWIVDPSHAVATNVNQFLFVNGRFVRDKIFANAVRRGYQERLHGQRVPAYVLYLDIPPEDLDVNVHPAKYEVRFHKGQQVHGLVKNSISKMLSKTLSQNGSVTSDITSVLENYKNRAVKDGHDGHDGYEGYNIAAHNGNNDDSNYSLSLGANIASTPSGYVRSPKTNYGDSYDSSASDTLRPGPLSKLEDIRRILGDTSSNRDDPDNPAGDETQDFATDGYLHPLGYAVAQMHGIYIIAINQDGLLILDMHAAHERILFEELKEQKSRNRIEQQKFLLPINISLLASEVDFVTENLDSFAKWGLELRVTGQESVVVESIPTLIAKENISILVQKMIVDFREYTSADDKNTMDEHTEDILSTMSCYGAVRANRRISIAEMNVMLRRLEATKSGHLCNHGRPTWWQISRKEIDKQLLHGK